MRKWARANYQPGLPLGSVGRVTASKEHIELSKDAAAEGAVLLKNNGVLPFTGEKKLALFGKGSFDYVKGGGGSGDVSCPYIRTFHEGLSLMDGISLYMPLADFYQENVRWQYQNGKAPGMTAEPGLSEGMVKSAREFTDTAVFCISRFSGEGWDRSEVECTYEPNPWVSETTMPKLAREIYPGGDFYLTKEERALLEKIKGAFQKIVVVVNAGGVIDTSWIKEDGRIDAALYAWQGGMEGGLAVAELLTGRKNPSGKLPDTFAESLESYPTTANFHESFDYVEYTEDIFVGYRYFETIPEAKKNVVYPFGYGLSYTSFRTECVSAARREDELYFTVKVENIGEFAGKEVVCIYFSAPQGTLGKASRELFAFAKTESICPNASEVLVLQGSLRQMSSFDDEGKIEKSTFVLEKGEYHFYLGGDVDSAKELGFVVSLKKDRLIEKCPQKLAPTSLSKRLRADGHYDSLPVGTPYDLNECLFEKMEPGTEEGLTPEVPFKERSSLFDEMNKKGILFSQVADGTASLDDFIEQLTDEELLQLLGGQPNTGVANVFGIGNLPKYEVPSVMTADGPAGVRIHPDCGIYATAWPCATLLGATFNAEMVEQIGAAGGAELKENNLQVWLTPGMNIHRHPLCGRNFEYYSEDPYLTGKLAAALVRGIQSNGVSACPKHFAANNKETNRKHSDSRVSERALREIYLRAFRIVIEEARPWTIMSSYNAINGRRASESRELLVGILRDEWGFDGCVISDWWTRGEHYKEILAGNDVKMACGFPERVRKAMEAGAVCRENLVFCARHVLEMLLRLD